MEVRDPIHGLIKYSPLEEQVINSRAMQRLRGIHQLAMAYLVYPGAVHTRFDHSLGVMHVAGQMAESLNKQDEKKLLSDEEIENIRLAALLHDVGHGPFSHVSEMPLAALSKDYLEAQSVAPEKVHELVTVDIVTHDDELRSTLGERGREIANIIALSTTPNVSQSIVSGPLDADKLDYLLRDSYFCGVKYGVYDLERVLDGLRVISAPSKDSYLGVAEESVAAVEQHLMARYQMTMQVYRHRIRRSTDILLSRAIVAAADECGRIRDLYTYEGDAKEFCARWLAFEDHKLLDAIMTECAGGDARELVSRLLSRKLPLRVCEMPLTQVGMFLQGKLAKPERRSELEGRIADHLGVRRCLVIVDLVQTDPPHPSSTEPGIDPSSIYVDAGEVEPKSFGEVSDIFSGNPLGGTRRIVVYVPFHSAEKAGRERERKELSAEVEKMMERWGKEA